MKEVTEKTNLTADTIRYYEKIGIIPPILRKENGLRDFQAYDLEWLFFIKQLRAAGLSIETLQSYKNLVLEGDETIAERIELLSKTSDFIAEKQAELAKAQEMLKVKINFYQEKVYPVEAKLKK